MAEAKVGVIGGTGLYQLEGMTKVKELKVKTPFGDPSDAIILGEIDGVKVAFLPRHGRGHFISRRLQHSPPDNRQESTGGRL